MSVLRMEWVLSRPRIHRPGINRNPRNALMRRKERHRLQSLALDVVLARLPTQQMTMLHFAPEPFFRGDSAKHSLYTKLLKSHRRDVNSTASICRRWRCPSASYGIVVPASHALEHVRDDRAALREIHRILRPGGVAILPVPIVAEGEQSSTTPQSAGVDARPSPRSRLLRPATARHSEGRAL